jgi:peptide methionine sulfoxide reductase MsrB
MELSHDLSDNASTLDVTFFGAQSHLGHLIDDSALDRLQSIASVGKGARIDDGVGILEE